MKGKFRGVCTDPRAGIYSSVYMECIAGR